MYEIGEGVIRKAASGDMAAFEDIYHKTSGLVYNVALRIVVNKQDAEEVTQDVFLKVSRNLKSFQFRSSLTTWIYRITVNTALNFIRSRSKVARSSVSYEDAVGSGANIEQKDTGAQEPDEPEELLKDLLEALTPDQRACVVLRSVEGLSYQEIADVLKININTVRSRLKRAREAMLLLRKRRDKT